MVGEPFNKRSVPCAFGIKIGLYFQRRSVNSKFTDLFLSLCGIEETDPQCVFIRFHSFWFSRNERREVYGVGTFAKKDIGDVRRQTSACGGMVAK